MTRYTFNQYLTDIKDQLNHNAITAQEGIWALYDFLNRFEADTVHFNHINDVLVEPSTNLITQENGDFTIGDRQLTNQDVIEILDACAYQYI